MTDLLHNVEAEAMTTTIFSVVSERASSTIAPPEKLFIHAAGGACVCPSVLFMDVFRRGNLKPPPPQARYDRVMRSCCRSLCYRFFLALTTVPIGMNGLLCP